MVWPMRGGSPIGRTRGFIVAGLGAAAVAMASPTVAAAGFGPIRASPAGAPTTVWAVGDGAIRTDSARSVARLIRAGDPAAFLYLGDVYEYGTPAEFARNYAPLYGHLRRITLPTPGNHDWPNHAVGYDRYWSRVSGRTPPHHYAVTVAGWRIISLNSEMDHAASSRQTRWLRRQVRAPGTCRIAFWHRPRFSAGLHGDQPDIAPLWRALRGRAALVLNGHEHDMQQLRRRNGIIQLIAGAGGRARYPVDAGDRRLAWSDDDTDGALRLRLTPGRARFSFVAADGRVLRSGAVRCRARSRA